MARMLTAIRAGVFVTAVLAGPPLVLLAVAGNPIPDRLPTAGQFQLWVDEPFQPRYAAATARAFVWLLWTLLAFALLAGVWARLRRRPWQRIAGYLPGPVQGLAAALVGAATVTTATSGLATAGPPSSTTASDGLASSTLTAGAHTAGATTSPAADMNIIATGRRVSDVPPVTHPVDGATTGPGARGFAPQLPLYTVARGDRMVDVAERFLGDGRRYLEIARLNPRWERHDDRFPDHWEPGWRVVLPADAHGRGPHRHAAGQLIIPGTGPARPGPPPGTTTPDGAASSTGTNTTRPTPTGSDTAIPGPDRLPATSAGPSTTAVSPAPVSPSTDPQATPTAGAQHGVDVPGGWVGLPLAAALLCAAAMVWRRRRHHYRPRPVGDGPLDDADLRPLPPVLTRLRQAVRDQDPGLLDPQPAARHPTVAEFVNNDVDTDDLDSDPAGPSGTDLAGLADTIPAGGLGLAGPGAAPAARALLVAALSAGSPTDPDARGHVIITADAVATLLGCPPDQLAPLPRLVVTASIPEALTRVEELLLERRRQLQEYHAADLPALRAATPYHPPMPPVLLLADVPPAELTARLSATTSLGAALQISAVLLGEWASGATATVHPDGRLTEPGRPRLATLDMPTTLQLLDVLREAYTGQPGNPPDICDPSGVAESRPATDGAAPPASTADTPPPVEPAASRQAPATAPATISIEAREPCAAPATRPTQADPGDTPPANPTRTSPQAVRVRMLGEPAIIERDGTAVTGLRFHARQLLVYLAVYRDGADLPQIMEAFWPSATLRRAGERLSTEVGHLRGRLRNAAGDQTIQPVINTGGRYVLNAAVLNLDLWGMSDALHRAGAATDRPARIAALREAIVAHTGPLADGQDYDWIEPHREQVRRHGVRARLHLAELIVDADPRHAATLAQAAADIDPYNEDAACRAMRMLARADDADGIRDRLQRLRDALDDIDEEPADETLTLAAQLQRQTSANPAARSANSTPEARDDDVPRTNADEEPLE